MKLCTDFPGLDPIRLLDYPIGDVLDLIREYLDHRRRTEPQQDIQRPTPGGGQTTKVIRRPADDSWF